MAKRYLVVTFDGDESAVRAAVQTGLDELGIEFSTTCNAHEPPVSDQADPAIADRITAIDLLVQNHPDCRPGGTMAEHAAAVLARHDAQNKTIADHSSVLQSVAPAALAAAVASSAARKAKNAAMLAEADAQRKAHADATQALAAKLKAS